MFLFDLTQNIFGCPKFAFFTSYLFCFNPASIFFSSCYTESLYALCGEHDKSLNFTNLIILVVQGQGDTALAI